MHPGLTGEVLMVMAVALLLQWGRTLNRRTPIQRDREKYRWRNLVERLFNKLKNWRRVATRYDKTTQSYLGFVALASVTLWLPFVHVA